MAKRIRVRRGIAALWTSENPILASGEMGMETDTRKIKFGDGSTEWNDLLYAPAELPSNEAYDADDWNGVTTTAPSKNAVRDVVETLQPLNSNLTAYAEDPEAAILANMPAPLELDEVPTSQVVTDAGTQQVETLSVYPNPTSEPVSAVVRVFGNFVGSPIVVNTGLISPTPSVSAATRRNVVYTALNASSAFTAICETGSTSLTSVNVIRKRVNGVALADDNTFRFTIDFTPVGGSLYQSLNVVDGVAGTFDPAVPVPEHIGQTAIVTIDDVKTVWTAVSLTEWKESGSDLTSGPVTSSGGVSAIADGALSIAKTSGLQSALDAKLTAAAVATALGIPSYASLALANGALPIGSLFINTGENPDQLQITTA